MTSDFEFGFIEHHVAGAQVNIPPQLYSEELKAAALKPFAKVKARTLPEIIDQQVLLLMRASEGIMTSAGDVYDAFVAEHELGLGDIVITHEDQGIQAAYKKWFDDIDADYWIHDALLTSSVYGNAFTVVLGDGQDFTITNLNPMRVAVGMSINARAMSWFGNDQSLMFHRAESPRFNEWQDIIDGGGMPLNPDTVYHLHTPKPHHQRYGIPRPIYAWNDITTRFVLDEMIRGTVEGIQNQIRVWKFKDPGKGEIALFRDELRRNRLSRVHDLAWRDNLTVETVMPGVVDELLANETWVRLTSAIFRKLGMSLRLVSQTIGMEVSGRSDTMEAEILVHISRLRQRIQRPGIALANKIAYWIAQYADTGLRSYPPPTIKALDTYITISELVRNVYVPLLNFGIVSSRTVHEGIGLDHETEIKRLESELDLRESGVIAPYTGFAQSGPGGITESPQSKGRPSGADTNPDNAAKNKENANA